MCNISNFDLLSKSRTLVNSYEFLNGSFFVKYFYKLRAQTGMIIMNNQI